MAWIGNGARASVGWLSGRLDRPTSLVARVAEVATLVLIMAALVTTNEDVAPDTLSRDWPRNHEGIPR
jgi:hypothetical protein